MILIGFVWKAEFAACDVYCFILHNIVGLKEKGTRNNFVYFVKCGDNKLTGSYTVGAENIGWIANAIIIKSIMLCPYVI